MKNRTYTIITDEASFRAALAAHPKTAGLKILGIVPVDECPGSFSGLYRAVVEKDGWPAEVTADIEYTSKGFKTWKFTNNFSVRTMEFGSGMKLDNIDLLQSIGYKMACIPACQIRTSRPGMMIRSNT